MFLVLLEPPRSLGCSAAYVLGMKEFQHRTDPKLKKTSLHFHVRQLNEVEKISLKFLSFLGVSRRAQALSNSLYCAGAVGPFSKMTFGSHRNSNGMRCKIPSSGRRAELGIFGDPIIASEAVRFLGGVGLLMPPKRRLPSADLAAVHFSCFRTISRRYVRISHGLEDAEKGWLISFPR